MTETRQWAAERVAVEERLRHIADHDALTGLYNRRRFEQELDRHIVHGRRYGMDGALLVIDLDRFKQVNDGHGHSAGDRVLAAVASVLRARLRESDILARFGGDEFAVLMPHGGAAEAAELANLVVNAIRREVATPAGALDASVGCALFEDATTSSTRCSPAPTTRCTRTRRRAARRRGICGRWSRGGAARRARTTALKGCGA